MKNNARKSDLSHRYHTRVIANIIYSTLVACLIDVFLVTNLNMLAEYAQRSEHSSALLNMVGQSDVVVVLVYVLIGILAFAVTFLLLQEKCAAYIGRISDAVERISEGDLNTQVEVVGDDEFSSMASNLNKMVEDIRRLMDKERESERTKNELITNVAHDLRTPLTSISGNAGILLNSPQSLDSARSRQLIADIAEDSAWLINLVENLLSITRINGDRAQLQTTWEVVEEVVGGAVGKFQKQFAQIEVETSMPEEVVMAPMDGILVEQVLVNLMENSAIHGKTTTKIRISVQKLPERVLFCVEDNGKGIDPAILPIIFEGQLPTGDHDASDGKRSMGIGLSVCMSIIQAHQGDMKAENMAAHRGARIQFWLPCQEENWMEEA